MIEQLRARHADLRKRTSPTHETPAPDLVTEIESFFDVCVRAGKLASNVSDRIELRSMLSHWAIFLYGTTNEAGYLTVDIAEPDFGLTNLRLSFEDLGSRCQQHATEFTARRVAEGVFDPKHAVPRLDAEKLLSEFVQGDRSGLVITGDSGVGKTFLMCQLASGNPKHTGGETTLVLPYDCQELGRAISPLDRSVRMGIERQIAQDLGITANTSLAVGLAYVDGFLRQRNAYLLVCFDTIERFKVSLPEAMAGFQEVLKVMELLRSLSALIKSLHVNGITRIKFLLISVQAVWRSFNLDRTLSWGQFLVPNSETRSLVMGDFGDDEFEMACRAYDIPEESVRELKDLTGLNPYMLYLASERQDELKGSSSDIRAKQEILFKEYYERRIFSRGTQEEAKLKQIFLKEFARKARRFLGKGHQVLGVPSGDAILSDPTCELLKADGIIVQEQIRDPFPELVIRLHPPILAEFLRKWYAVASATSEAEVS
jgi:hypothetical protein